MKTKSTAKFFSQHPAKHLLKFLMILQIVLPKRGTRCF